MFTKMFAAGNGGGEGLNNGLTLFWTFLDTSFQHYSNYLRHKTVI